MLVAFTIPGDPRGKGRARASVIPGKDGGRGRARFYTDSKTASYENRVALAAEKAMGGRPLLDEPLQIEVTVRLAPAASASRKARAAMLGGRWATKKPDLDNALKAVLDGCNKIVFRDDVLVSRMISEKVWADLPGVDVVIRPLSQGAI